MSLGMILSKKDVMSCTRPGSYSTVVTAPVDPGTKTVATPVFIPEPDTADWTSSVMSKMSVPADEPRSRVSV
jgi:hypothetical protein